MPEHAGCQTPTAPCAPGPRRGCREAGADADLWTPEDPTLSQKAFGVEARSRPAHNRRTNEGCAGPFATRRAGRARRRRRRPVCGPRPRGQPARDPSLAGRAAVQLARRPGSAQHPQRLGGQGAVVGRNFDWSGAASKPGDHGRKPSRGPRRGVTGSGHWPLITRTGRSLGASFSASAGLRDQRPGSVTPARAATAASSTASATSGPRESK